MSSEGGFDVAIIDVSAEGRRAGLAGRRPPGRGRAPRSSSPPAAMSSRRPPEHAGAPVLSKPYTIDAIEPALEQACGGLSGSAVRRRRLHVDSCSSRRSSSISSICAGALFRPDRAALPGRPGRRRRPLPPAPSGSSSPRRPASGCAASTSRPRRPARERLLILGFGGNAWNAAGRRGLSARPLSRRPTSSPSTIAAIRRAAAGRAPRRCSPTRPLIHDFVARALPARRGSSPSASASAAASPPPRRAAARSTG